jgi:hypothetical protein
MRAGAESPHTLSPWPEFLPGFVRRRGVSRVTQVILVCSARARIGKTLLSRLIVEYCRADAQPVAAYTIHPIDRRGEHRLAYGNARPDGAVRSAGDGRCDNQDRRHRPSGAR